jgi:hypothetical protein
MLLVFMPILNKRILFSSQQVNLEQIIGLIDRTNRKHKMEVR